MSATSGCMYCTRFSSRLPSSRIDNQYPTAAAEALRFGSTNCILYDRVYGHHISQSIDRPGKVANPARGQLNRGNTYFPVPVRA